MTEKLRAAVERLSANPGEAYSDAESPERAALRGLLAAWTNVGLCPDRGCAGCHSVMDAAAAEARRVLGEGG